MADMRWQIPAAIVSGLLVVWLSLLIVVWRARRHDPNPANMREVLRLVPDVMRLLRRLAGDSTLPRRTRSRVCCRCQLRSPHSTLGRRRSDGLARVCVEIDAELHESHRPAHLPRGACWNPDVSHDHLRAPVNLDELDDDLGGCRVTIWHTQLRW